MRIIILTQDDPFYLSDSLCYLFDRIPPYTQVVGCVVFDVSPFGKRESFVQKSTKTVRIFGMHFFMHYTIRYLLNKAKTTKKVKSILKKYHIPLIEIDGNINSESSLTALRAYDPDLLISIAGNQIFKKPLISLAPRGCLNLHTALLPKYRGLMPTFWVMKNDEHYTGVSVFFVDEAIDSGPILVQKRMDIGSRTQAELITHTKRLGMDAILESIGLVYNDNYELIQNNDAESTYFKFPDREDVNHFLKIGKKFY